MAIPTDRTDIDPPDSKWPAIGGIVTVAEGEKDGLRIFQLCDPRLPTAFPPLRASKVVRRNLASQRTGIRRYPRVRTRFV
ncbi:MAG: hypothetical protein ACRDJG_09865 [Actinomycetota bacterium]